MAIFEYKGVDGTGQAVSGTLTGPSLAAAAAALEQRGLSIEHLAPAVNVGDPIPADFGREGSPAAAVPPPQRHYVETHVVGQLIKVPLSDISFFFRQLGTMVHAGVGMVQTLETLYGQTHNMRLKSVIRDTADMVREGRPLSDGLGRYPDIFSPLMLALVRTGEKAGMLVETLRQTSEYIEREIKLRNLIRRVTLYPKLVIGASIFIIVVTNWIIKAVGGTNLIASPLTSWSTWVLLLPFIIGTWFVIKFVIPNPQMKVKWDRIMLGIPYFGVTNHQLAMAKFGRAFASLYRGGVPPRDATILSAEACGNEHLRWQIQPAAKRVEEGVGITQAFAETRAFSPIVLDMISTGENTGNLDMMLEKMAEFYEDDSETRATASGHVLGVICLVVVGIYVGYVVINFYIGHAQAATGA